MAELSMYRGDNSTIILNVSQGGGEFDLTDCSMWFTVKENKSDADESAVMMLETGTDAITFTNAAAGEAAIEIVPGDTYDLSVSGTKTLLYDIQLKTPAGKVYTIDTGTLVILEDLTREYV